ncbi:arylsulfotransferase family protein [Halococcus sp. IIIV-5B]|uniref:arylsulfotransferase family protein n=1 Tax=Halococcus sp. IIIV-5B TaxID=2321230 RepID=UPI000E7468BA|nr:arylsulfotransferase family protein [Halococcus sp. IIIV-5B]RJT04738.1 hypothetical protein D3261_09020 [Halococcus sp. IIIV-5B]
MRSPTRQQIGILLICLSIVAVIGSLGVSAVTTPNTGISSTSSGDDYGQTLVGVQAGGRVSLFNSSGDRLWSTGGGNVDYFDVTKMKNGSVVAGFIAEGQQSCGPYESPCARTGFRVIDPTPEPRITGEWSFPVRTKLNSEVHDVNPLPNGEFLLTDMDHERIMTVAENGSITWQWNASQYYDAPPDPTRQDWLHINDVDRIGPDRYMVSVREANQLLIIERGQGVVNVINKDQPGNNGGECQRDGDLADYNNDSNGSVHCGDPDILKQQHNPQYLGPDAVLVADSENNRIVELHNQSGNWTVAWSVDSANGVQFNWPRDADRLPNGNTLITDTRNNRVVEVTPSGEAVWGVDTAVWPYEADRLPTGSQQNADRLLQYGEYLNNDQLPRMNATAESGEGGRAALPLVGMAYNGLSYVVALPIWFQPWHVAVVAAAILMTLLGGGLVWSGRRN